MIVSAAIIGTIVETIYRLAKLTFWLVVALAISIPFYLFWAYAAIKVEGTALVRRIARWKRGGPLPTCNRG